MKHTQPKIKRRRGPRHWRESFTVWIDFAGPRCVQPLLEHIAGVRSQGSGTMLIGPQLSDISWSFDAQEAAESVFEKLKAACRGSWTEFVEIRLLHDDKPDRCGPLLNPDGTFSRGSGPLVLKRYRKGKLPTFHEKRLHNPPLKKQARTKAAR